METLELQRDVLQQRAIDALTNNEFEEAGYLCGRAQRLQDRIQGGEFDNSSSHLSQAAAR